LKSLLERFPIFLVRGVFYGDRVITFADLSVFLRFALALLWNINKLRRGVGSKTNLAMSSCSKQPR
jgi:hypothetical protein